MCEWAWARRAKRAPLFSRMILRAGECVQGAEGARGLGRAGAGVVGVGMGRMGMGVVGALEQNGRRCSVG